MVDTKDRIEMEHHESIPDGYTDHVEVHRAITYEEEPSTIYKLGLKTFLAITALALANCCAAIVNTTNTIIKFQVKDVGGSDLASWIANGNFLMTLTFGPILGSLGDRLGKKWFIVGGAAIGIVGSCLSGSSHSVERIIAGNILTGLANAGCIVSVAASQEITPNRLRPWAMGYTQTLGSIAAVIGTFCAGAFVKYHSWRWSYYLNAFVYLLAGSSTLLAYHPPPPALRRHGRLAEIFASVDYIGIFLLAGSLASILIGLTWGGTTYAWNSWRIIVTLVVGCSGLVILGLYEWLIKKDGLFDHRLFRSRNFPILLFVCTIDGMLLLGVNVLYAQEIADLFSTDAVRIAVIISPFLITSTFGCLPAGWLMASTKSFRTVLIGALFWCSLFTGLMALVTPERIHWAYAFTTLFGVGTAVTTVIPIVALALSVPSFLLGTAGTLSISCRALGGIVGITIFTSIYDNKYATNLPLDITKVILSQPASSSGSIPAPSSILAALSNTNIPAAVSLEMIHPPLPKSLIGELLGAVATAQSDSWKWVWVAVSALVAANAIVACFSKPVRDRMNDHIESALEDTEVRKAQMEGKI